SVAGTTDSSAPSDEPRGAGNFVHIEGNVIEPSSSAVPKRAIALQNAVGIIRGNQLAATTQDLWFQEPTVVTSNPPEQRVLRIEHNWFFGRLQLYLPAASNVQEPVRIRGNRFIYPGSSFSPPGLPSGISSLLGNGSEAHSVRIMAAQSQPTLVEDNRFLGFRANYRALWVMSRAGVVVQDNDFIPDAGQSDFTAVLVGNRQVWNGLPAPTPYGVTFLRNRFHANGAALNNKAKAIVFV